MPAPAFELDRSKSPVLAALPDEAVAQLFDGAEELTFAAQDIIMEDGTDSDSIFFITRGEMEVLKDGHVIDRQGAGGVLGEMGVITGMPRSATVRAKTDVTALKVTADAILQIADEHPQILRSLIGDLINKVKSSQGVRADQASQIEQAEQTLSRCVAPEVLERIRKDKTAAKLLEGTLDDAAILFFDIKGFSTAAEKMGSQELLQALNMHIGIINECVAAQEGTVVNYIGDAVLAAFNCPVVIDDPAAAALLCYKLCRKRIAEMHAQLKDEEGGICFELGAGINFGNVVSGAIGSENRFNFTIIGDEVNLAARLEGLTRRYPAEVILSGSCHDRLTPELADQCIQFDLVQVKGRKTPVELFTLTSMDGVQKQAFRAAVQTYLSGAFEKAAEAFRTIDDPMAGYLVGRCQELLDRIAEGGYTWPGHYTWSVK